MSLVLNAAAKAEITNLKKRWQYREIKYACAVAYSTGAAFLADAAVSVPCGVHGENPTQCTASILYIGI